MEPLTLILVFVVGVLAAFIGTNTGGSGLLTIPSLIFFGLPPHVAIATSRLGSVGQIGGGIFKFNKGGKVDAKLGLQLAGVSILGALLGAYALLVVSEELLGKLVGLFILVTLVFLLLKRDAGVRKSEKPAFPKHVSYFLFFLVAFWGGFFGGGTGIFATYILIFGFNQTFLESAGTRKIPGVVMVGLSLAIFALSGIVEWIPGFALMAGTAVGSYAGAGHAIKKGDGWVRGLFVVVALASAIKLIF
jgi:uncharacterized membrane protein YfcA